MSTQVYVVIKKYNHLNPFQPSLVPSPVVEWNGGTTHIEGVYTYHPTQYTHNMGYQIYGPYNLNGALNKPDIFQQSIPNAFGPPLNYPQSSSFNLPDIFQQSKPNVAGPALNYPQLSPFDFGID